MPSLDAFQKCKGGKHLITMTGGKKRELPTTSKPKNKENI